MRKSMPGQELSPPCSLLTTPFLFDRARKLTHQMKAARPTWPAAPRGARFPYTGRAVSIIASNADRVVAGHGLVLELHDVLPASLPTRRNNIVTDEFSHRGLTQRNHRALDFALTARRFHSRPLFGQSDQYFVLLVASNTSVRSIPSTSSSISAPFQSSYGTGKRRPTAEAVAEPIADAIRVKRRPP